MNINIDKLIENCDLLERRTLPDKGCMSSSVRCFDACMRAFDCAVPAEAVTFKVYLGMQVMAYGEATIHRDGRMEMRRV